MSILPSSIGPGEKVTATATDPDGNTSEFSQRLVLSSNPTSGNPAGVAGVALDRLPLPFRRGRHRRRRRCAERRRERLQRRDHHDAEPSARNVERRDADEHRRHRRNAAQRLDRGFSGRSRRPAVLLLRHDSRPQPDHRRRGRRQLRRHAEHAAPADGGLPAQGEVRHLLRAASLHRAGFPGCALLLQLRAVDQRTRRARASPEAAPAATSVPPAPSTASRWRSFS